MSFSVVAAEVLCVASARKKDVILLAVARGTSNQAGKEQVLTRRLGLENISETIKLFHDCLRLNV